MKKWYKLLLACSILTVIYYSLPRLHRQIPGSQRLNKRVVEKNIDVSALFYSEEHNTAAACRAIEEKLHRVQPED